MKLIHLLSLSFDQNLLTGQMGDSLNRQKEYAEYFTHTTILVLNRVNTLHAARYTNLDIIPINATNKFSLFIKTISKAIQIHRQKHFNLITTQDPLASGLVGVILKKILKIKLNIQVHNDFFTSEKGLSKRLMFWCLSRADSIRTVSQNLNTKIKSCNVQRTTCNVFTAPVRVNLSIFYRPASYKPKITKFISVGRLIPEKNFDLLIEVFIKLHAKFPDISLTIIGDGPLYQKLLNTYHQQNQYISLVGAKTPNEVAQLLHQHHVFILTSQAEGWGLVFVEAFAAGLPIITAPVSSVGELLQPNLNCLVAASNVESLVASCQSLIDHPAEAYRLARNGQMWVKQNLESKVLVKQWIDGLYQTIDNDSHE